MPSSTTIINPATRRAVKVDGLIGQALLSAIELKEMGTDLGKLYRQKCPGGGAWDPATKRCVTTPKDGRLGALLALSATGNRNRLAAANGREEFESDHSRQLMELHAQRQAILAERAQLNRNRQQFEDQLRLFEAQFADLDV
jgi:hypothetical protein